MNWGIAALQAAALPLGDGTSFNKKLQLVVPEAGLEPAHPYERGILNPLCLPISPPGHEQSVFDNTGRTRRILC